MKPLAYAYMRIFCDVTDEQVLALEQRIHLYAQGRSLELVDIFAEFDNGSQAVFNELAEQLERTGARTVIVPSLRHFSKNQVLQHLMLARLEEAIGAKVRTLSGV
jgi:hypothetical protein